ncbi:MAG: PA2169 family four-helix-bundle protein [Sphingomonadales bacterium]|nr:PA2169 family four-helix-bundle protein [Sphingomonadales bacterium]
MFTDKDTDTLNSLIATTLDSVDGYREAAEKTDNAGLATAFTSRANEREQVVRTFQDKVRAAGGNPEDDGTILAGAHRVFLSLRDAITGDRDDDAIVAEVERGEDHIKSKFEDAMKQDDLSPEIRTCIADCYTSVKQGHDQMSNLKHAMGAH